MIDLSKMVIFHSYVKQPNGRYLVGGLEHFIFFHILGTIMPFD
jgi:hypothetical protein